MKLIDRLVSLKGRIGDTEAIKLNIDGFNCFAKLEYNNFSGSVKDRAAFNILYHAIAEGKVTERTTIVESSSGNFAIAIASICNILGLRFVAVIDPNINSGYEMLLRILAHQVIKVEKRDFTGGYLLTRLDEVRSCCSKRQNVFWTDQYNNPNNYLAYFNELALEIRANFKRLDFLFVAVSTCGTITGISKRIRSFFPQINVIGVDIEGSIVFQNNAQPRYISGLGSSQRPEILKESSIDDAEILTHLEIVQGSWDLLKEQSLFAGASTGACYFAIKKWAQLGKIPPNSNVLFLCADKGGAYQNTVYNAAWVKDLNMPQEIIKE